MDEGNAESETDDRRARRRLHMRVAFLVSRTEYLDPRQHVKREKGREIAASRLPPGSEALFEEAKRKEWAKHLEYDVFEIRYDLDASVLRESGKNVLSLRYVLTDKAESTRAGQTYEQHPVQAKARLVTPGYADLENLHGHLKKDAPTLPQEALGFIFQLCASQRWTLQHGDIESAFLSGAYFEREV